MTDATPATPIKADLLYGCEAIGEFLGLTGKQVQHQVTLKRLPHFRIGATICATKSVLTVWLNDLATGSPQASQASQASQG